MSYWHQQMNQWELVFLDSKSKWVNFSSFLLFFCFFWVFDFMVWISPIFFIWCLPKHKIPKSPCVHVLRAPEQCTFIFCHELQFPQFIVFLSAVSLSFTAASKAYSAGTYTSNAAKCTSSPLLLHTNHFCQWWVIKAVGMFHLTLVQNFD